MIKRLIIAATAVAVLGAPAAALADDEDRRDRYERRWEKQERKFERQHRQLQRREARLSERERRFRERYRDYYGERPGYYYAPRYGYYDVPQSYYGRSWSRGQRLPSYFYDYRAYDPYAYGAYAPPRGSQWYHAGDDLYLADPTTGLILDVLSNIF